MDLPSQDAISFVSSSYQHPMLVVAWEDASVPKPSLDVCQPLWRLCHIQIEYFGMKQCILDDVFFLTDICFMVVSVFLLFIRGHLSHLNLVFLSFWYSLVGGYNGCPIWSVLLQLFSMDMMFIHSFIVSFDPIRAAVPDNQCRRMCFTPWQSYCLTVWVCLF